MARILVIDDVRGVRRSIAAVLQRAGHDVLEAEGGTEGVALFGRHQPSIVLTDMLMTDLDGLETIDQIRRMPSGRTAKIVAMSGGGSLVDTSEALMAAERIADATLRKPFESDELLQTVSRLAGKA